MWKICDEYAKQDNRVEVIHKEMVDLVMPEMLEFPMQKENISFFRQ